MTETKALIVEHDEKSRLILDEVLLAIGHRYEIATSQSEARERLKTNGYAYVLLNCMIPARPGGMPRRQNAENFLDDLRDIKGDSMPPVIVMFDPMPETDEEFKVNWSCDLVMLGAKGFVQKPFRTESRTLDRVIKQVLAGLIEPICCPATSDSPGKVELPNTRHSPEVTEPRWVSIPNEAIGIDDFMARFCEPRSRENRLCRKRALLAAARHRTITLPPLAGPRKHGQSNRYFVHDLLASWQGFMDEGVNLPPLCNLS